MSDLFFCPLCGERLCKTMGLPCEVCRGQRMLRRENAVSRGVVGICFYCRQNEVVLTDEHVVPLARGGPDEPWNIVRACEICNRTKSDKIPSEWCPEHEEAVAIERRVTTILPRMRNGRLVGGSEDAAGRVRVICAEFVFPIRSLLREMRKSDPAYSRTASALRSVQRLESSLA